MDNLGTLLAHNMWQSIIIFAFVFVILKLIKNTSAEEKSWSWSATLFALALLPLAAFLPGKGIDFDKAGQRVAIEATDAPMFKEIEQAEATTIKTKPKFKKIKRSEFSLPVIGKDDLIKALLLFWFCGTLVALLRLSYAAYNASRLRQKAYPFAGLDDNNWPQSIEIAICDRINGPIVIGIFKPLILIPRGFAQDMLADELKPLLYHELAHVKRHDNLFHFIERIIIALYWWNPVMHFIAARIAEERELACDDRAANSCGDGLVYAKSLLKGARKLMGDNHPVLGLAVLRRESVLSKRINRLTVRSALGGLNINRLVKNLSALFAAIFILCIVTPRIAVGQVDVDKKDLNSVEMVRDGQFLEVEWKGNIDIDDQDSEITSLSEDGYFSLVTEDNGERKEIIISNNGEETKSSFLENGSEREMTTEDKAWQRYALVDMLRLSGINAEKRVDRIYKEGGAAKVIEEISMMHSDYSMRLYTEALVEIYDLEQNEIQRLIMIVADMDSDYEKGMAFRSIADEQDLDGGNADLLASVAPDDEDFYVSVEFDPISDEDRAEMKREIERQLAELPTEEELEQIRREALEAMPSKEELAKMRKEALESLPSEEELEEMRAAALASIPSAEELEAMHAEAIADLPTDEELSAMVEEALESIPTADDLEQMRKEALESLPSKEEFKRMREDVIKGLPTEEEFEEMRTNIEENMLNGDDLERIRRELQDKLKNLPDMDELEDLNIDTQIELSHIRSEELSAVIDEQIEKQIELSLTIDEVKQLSAEIRENISEIRNELDEQSFR